MKNNKSFWDKHEGFAFFLIGVVILVIIIGLILGSWLGIKTVSRSQKRADANNQVTLNEIQIKQTNQLVEVQKQKAQVKIEEAKGIAEAQRLINGTLTAQYLQHEAIQSQETQSNKIVYIPSGNQGIPLVNNVSETK